MKTFDYFVKEGKENKEIKLKKVKENGIEKWQVKYWGIKTCFRPKNGGVTNYHGDSRKKKNNEKYGIFQDNKKIKIGINEFESFILSTPDENNLPTGSFVLEFKINLLSPYFSADEDGFYPIDNPVKKEKVLKLPYIPGSSWKGYLLSAGKKLVQEYFDKGEYEEGIKKIFHLWRIFGAGGTEFENLAEKYKDFKGFFEEFRKLADKDKRKDIEKTLIDYLAFEIGVIRLKDNKKIDWKGLEKEKPEVFKVRKGRLTILPTFFESISLEIANPHNRKTRSGTMPIYFEVIPKGEMCTLKLIYSSWDLIGKNKEKIKKEEERDLEFICKLVERVGKEGIGAKTKYGWGRFEIINKDIYKNL